MRDRVRQIHFVGIGGAGMSGIAEVLLNLGYQVTGSDLQASTATERLARAGATISQGHAGCHVAGSDVVVVSSAVAADNIEVQAAQAARIPVIPRAEMLGELMRFRKGIAVAGTHGKTTTTSLIASVLGRGGLDPTFVVGGLVHSVASSARFGSGEYLVAEADESDASFLHLAPEMAVITNIDADHMATYDGDFDRLTRSFLAFLQNLPFYGVAILCLDDPVLRALADEVRKPVVSYGFSADADYRAVDVEAGGLRMQFKVMRPGARPSLPVDLAAPGRHNVLNALAAVALADSLAVSDAAVQAALAEFGGIDRRFQVLGELPVAGGAVTLVDDYAHHPRELAATLDTATGCWPGRRRVVVFQPHRYSRTRDLLDDFAQVLAREEVVVLTEVYAAGEAPLSGADGRALSRAVRARGQVEPVFVEVLVDLPRILASVVCADDVLLLLGAGDIGRMARRLVEQGLPASAVPCP